MKELPTLGFGEAIKLASSRLTVFSGRSRRSEFWWWMLIVMIVNQVASMFITNLWVSTIVATIIMFFGLAATARRLQDSGKSAWWVYISYGLFFLLNCIVAGSETFNKLVDELKSGSMNENAIQKIVENGAVEMMAASGLSLLASIVGLVVIVMCLLDSTPGPNKYGDSPKYVEE